MAKKEAKIIKAPKELQQKVGTGTVDAATIQKAQKVIEENTVDFEPLARPQLDLLKKALAEAKANPAKQNMNNLTQPIMNLKANAATFNYPLISDITGTVLNFLEHIRKVDGEIITIVDNLYKVVNLAIAQKITSTQNPVGAKLLEEFKDVCKRYVEKRL